MNYDYRHVIMKHSTWRESIEKYTVCTLPWYLQIFKLIKESKKELIKL